MSERRSEGVGNARINVPFSFETSQRAASQHLRVPHEDFGPKLPPTRFTMKVTVLLLASALCLLAVAAAPSPTPHKAMMKRHAAKTGNQNLKRIIDLAEKYNESLTREFFVDDVSPLVDAGCGPKFFCRVNDILHQRGKHFEDLVRNLDAYQRDVNCTVLLTDVTSTGVSIQLPELMKHLITCIRQTNFKGSSL